jgi:hypothetical protein
MIISLAVNSAVDAANDGLGALYQTLHNAGQLSVLALG